MSVFYQEEPPSHPKRCKCPAAPLKEVFSHCRNFAGRFSTASPEEDCPISNFDEQQEAVVSALRSRAIEKQKRAPNLLRDNLSFVYFPAMREFFFTPVVRQESKDSDPEEEGREEFMSVGSCFSCCSRTVTGEGFHSVKTNLSRSSSLSELDIGDFWKTSIFLEFCHCEGWPFGLCRKAVLLPPLPKPPTESWLLRKTQQSAKDA